MRILVMGSGGVGGYYGGILARQGHEVTFVARGAHLEALRERGLEVRDRDDTFLLRPAQAIGHPAEADGPVDLALFAVKTYDMESAAAALRPAVGDVTSVLPLQNGVDAVDTLDNALGRGHALAAMTQVGARLVEPGLVERFSPFCQVVLGEPSGGLSERAEQVAAALREVGVDASATDDAQRAVWEKFMLLAPLASMTSACAVTSGQVRAVPEGAALFRALRAEVCEVGRAAGVNLPHESIQSVETFFMGLPDTHMTSMQRDYDARRRVELDYLAGTVIRRGKALGVPTPRFDDLYAILKVRAESFGGLA